MENSLNPYKLRKEYAAEYGVTVKTFNTWLKREGLDIPTGKISPKNQYKIKKKFGDPNGKEIPKDDPKEIPKNNHPETDK